MPVGRQYSLEIVSSGQEMTKSDCAISPSGEFSLIAWPSVPYPNSSAGEIGSSWCRITVIVSYQHNLQDCVFVHPCIFTYTICPVSTDHLIYIYVLSIIIYGFIMPYDNFYQPV